MNTTISKEDLLIVIRDEVSKMVNTINESKKKSSSKAKPSPNPTPSKKNDGKKTTKKKHISETAKSKLKTIIMEELQSILKEAGFGQMVGNVAGNVVNAAKGFAQGIQQGYQQAGQPQQKKHPMIIAGDKLIQGRDVKALATLLQKTKTTWFPTYFVDSLLKALGLTPQQVVDMVKSYTDAQAKIAQQQPAPAPAQQQQQQPAQQQQVATGQPNRIGGANV